MSQCVIEMTTVAARRDVRKIALEHRVEFGVLLVARCIKHAQRNAGT